MIACLLVPSCQLSFEAMVVVSSCNSRVGSASAPGNGNDGPIARTITFFACVPVTINPPINTLSAVPTLSRVEIFPSCTGKAAGDGDGEGDGDTDGEGDGDTDGEGDGDTDGEGDGDTDGEGDGDGEDDAEGEGDGDGVGVGIALSVIVSMADGPCPARLWPTTSRQTFLLPLVCQRSGQCWH